MSVTNDKEEITSPGASKVHLCSYAELLDRTADDIVFHEDCTGADAPPNGSSVVDLCSGERTNKRERDDEAECDRRSVHSSNEGMGDDEDEYSDNQSNRGEGGGTEDVAVDDEDEAQQRRDTENSSGNTPAAVRRLHHDDSDFLALIGTAVSAFSNLDVCAEKKLKWAIALESMDEFAAAMLKYKSVRMRIVTGEVAGGVDESAPVVRKDADVYLRRLGRLTVPAIRRAVERLRSNSRLPAMVEWSFVHAELAIKAERCLVMAEFEVLPVFRSPSIVDKGTDNHMVCFGTNRAALVEAAAAKGYQHAAQPEEKKNHSEATTQGGVRVRLTKEVPQWLKPFYEKKILPFLDAKPNTRPVRLQLTPDWQIPPNKARDVSNIVRSLRYEVADKGIKHGFFLRRSVRVLVDSALYNTHGVHGNLEFDMLIEPRFLSCDIMELSRLRMFLYAETDNDLFRIRGYHSAQPDLVRHGQKLICLPNHRTVLNLDEQGDLKRFVIDFLKKSVHSVRASVPQSYMDDATTFLKHEFSNEVELVAQHGEVYLQRSPKKVVQSVNQSLSEWAQSNFAAGSLAFRVDDVFDVEIGQRVKSFAGSRNLGVSRVKDGRVVTFTLFVPRNESPDGKQAPPPPPPPPPPPQQQSPALLAADVGRAVRRDEAAEYVNKQNHPHHTYQQGAPAPQRIDVVRDEPRLTRAVPPKELYAEIAAGQAPLPGGYTCRYFPQYRQYVLLDHVRRQGFRPEVGEALTSFGAAIASGIQNVRSLVEGGAGMGASPPAAMAMPPPVSASPYAGVFHPQGPLQPQPHHHHHQMQMQLQPPHHYYPPGSYSGSVHAPQSSYSYASGMR